MTSGFYDLGSRHEHRLLFRLTPAHCHKTIILINVLFLQVLFWPFLDLHHGLLVLLGHKILTARKLGVLECYS
jgi:hypothetical protein